MPNLSLEPEQIQVLYSLVKVNLEQTKHVLDNQDRIIFALGADGIAGVKNRAGILSALLKRLERLQ